MKITNILLITSNLAGCKNPATGDKPMPTDPENWALTGFDTADSKVAVAVNKN